MSWLTGLGEFLLDGSIIAGCLLFAGANLNAVFSVLRVPRLSSFSAIGDVEAARNGSPAAERRWPLVSVIAAARNEGTTIEAAMRQLLRTDYPNLELVLVNDRSEDETGHIADQLALEDPRVRVVHVTELPPGWLGKVNALHQGTERASGDFFLFTDADVHLERGALRRAMALAEKEQLDHLAVLPHIAGKTLAVRVVIAAFGIAYLARLPVVRIGAPGSEAYAGVGAFGLVRRTAFERTEGWSWLRMEIADDLGLAMMVVRQARGRGGFATGGDQIRVEWYENLPEMVRGLEKNGFAAMAGFSWSKAALLAAVVPACSLMPVLAFLVPLPWLWLAGVIYFATLPLVAAAFSSTLRHDWVASLLGLFGVPVLGWAVARSAWQAWRTGHVSWRGTKYSLAELRSGRRVML